MKSLFILAVAVLCFSCSTSNNEISQKEDYAKYLKAETNPQLKEFKEEITFWETKYKATPNQYPYLSKMAAAENQWFQATGEIASLLKAGQYLETAIEKSSGQQAGLYRSLARNYISQHKFREAQDALMKAQELGENKEATDKMIFDVALELGDYELAKKQLSIIQDESDFDFLIRQAKWFDTQGNLDGAITKLQLATAKAEELKSESLKLWAYSNIGDFYGHAGKIQASYDHYLKALAIDPNHYYSLKGIAWIALSHDKNPDKAQEIITYIRERHNAPDYHLLLAEIADYKGDEQEKKLHIQNFFSIIASKNYGDMYNKYIVIEKPAESVDLAMREIENRPTPMSYDLFAWSLLSSGQQEKALQIAEQYVEGKTSEPEAQYHLAEIFKANGKDQKVKELKEELLEATYELGPAMTSKITQL